MKERKKVPGMEIVRPVGPKYHLDRGVRFIGLARFSSPGKLI